MTRLLSCGLLLTALALASSPVAAQNAPWCFSESGNRASGAVTCAFYSFEQCLETLRGIGGSCAPNPFFSYGKPYRPDGRTGKRNRRQ
jgi:hypothetical protein